MSALGIRTIIAATDLSDALIPALQASVRLAQLTDARLHIIHTTEARIPESRLADHLRAAHIQVGPTIDARIMVGPPGAVVVQDSVRLNADVIVLGPHQPGRSRLGSTAYRVVLGSETPCLMLPAGLTLPLKRVLVPVDMSGPSEGLLRVALTWASALRQRDHLTELIVLSVKPPGNSSARDAESLRDEVETICGPLNECAGLDVRCEVLEGVAPDVILSAAERNAVDLIVIGTRGEDLQRDALGSVSREVVSRAREPVLLVPRGVWQP